MFKTCMHIDSEEIENVTFRSGTGCVENFALSKTSDAPPAVHLGPSNNSARNDLSNRRRCDFRKPIDLLFEINLILSQKSTGYGHDGLCVSRISILDSTKPGRIFFLMFNSCLPCTAIAACPY